MLHARRLNVILTIQPGKEKEFAAQGYDIYEDGKLIRYADNKMIHVSEYLAMKDRAEKAEAELSALKLQSEAETKKKAAPPKKQAAKK